MQCPAMAAMKILGVFSIMSMVSWAMVRKSAMPAADWPSKVEMSAPAQKNFSSPLLITTQRTASSLRASSRQRCSSNMVALV